jgi:hypothetical protein
VPERAGLPASAERRLEAFSRRIERIRAENLLALAAHPVDAAAHERARMDAELVAIESGREAGVAEARGRAEQWVVGIFNASNLAPGWYEANWGRGGTVADRAALARALGEAFTAVALADVLPDDAYEELVGAFVNLAEDSAVSR